jgi:hypothetical protein
VSTKKILKNIFDIYSYLDYTFFMWRKIIEDQIGIQEVSYGIKRNQETVRRWIKYEEVPNRNNAQLLINFVINCPTVDNKTCKEFLQSLKDDMAGF